MKDIFLILCTLVSKFNHFRYCASNYNKVNAISISFHLYVRAVIKKGILELSYIKRFSLQGT